MATSLAPPAAQQGRISQLLPSVKCSNCSQPVPLSELGDHVCTPAAAPKAAGPSLSASLAGRLQNLVVPPPRQAIPHAPMSAGLPRTSMSPPAQPPYQRPRVLSASSSHSSHSSHSTHSGRIPAPSPLARGFDQPPRSSSSTPRTPSFDNAPLPPMARGASPAPSMHSMRGGVPSSPGPATRRRATSNASSIRTPPQMPPPQGHPPLAPRVNTPSYQHAPLSPASPRFQHQQPPPSSPSYFPPQSQTPSIHEQHGFGAPPGSPLPQEPDTQTGGEAGMAGVGRRGFAAVARAAMFAQHQPFIHPQHPPPSPGGSLTLPPGGMGSRRGGSPGHLDITNITSFPNGSASASTPPLSPNSGHSSPSPGPMSLSPQSISAPPLPGNAQGSRSPSPGITPIPEPQLNQPADAGGFGFPKLPLFDKLKNGMASPLNVSFPSSNTNPSTERERKLSSSESESDDDEPIDLGLFGSAEDNSRGPSRNNSQRKVAQGSDSSESEYGLAYADDTDEEDGPSDSKTPSKSGLTNATTPKSTIPPMTSLQRSPSSTSSGSSSVQGLAIRKKNSISSSSGSSEGDNRLDIDNKKNRDDIVSMSRYSKASSTYSRGTMMNRVTMNTVWEDRDHDEYRPPSPPSTPGGGLAALLARTAELESREPARDSILSDSRPKAQRSNTFTNASPAQSTVKLPMRSRTERESGIRRAARVEESGLAVDKEATPVQSKRRVRVCLRCEKTIEDGKWVKAENGAAGILCVKCWKNMYLPKCRRCNLPIENQAVSSSDGQLKGKYHRDCFNCHTCQKPFPDKTFYVFEGRPLCGYHYHEANDSLCAAALCGKPIEGPCAISHAGDKYHPEHITCEYPLSSCGEMLKEYWEVDGRMLCEKHCNYAGGTSGDSDYESSAEVAPGRRRPRKTQKSAQKRVTRFIDLTDVGLGGAGAADLQSESIL